ncbi:uncharacterized protein PV09_03478 [Verruconis gallopava]|uniref:Mercuric reductase n=1 Tax=Verruconis gallopava TaxID=253628 RepID=A0A0D1YY52_9PEZI|nr:uncharacterized protein PV09_03478 [Verruconis gallopava]KIW05607.1 hypothetical protein PV09_03478 [Verruconis gallopava]
MKQYDAILLGSGQGSTPLASSLANAGYKTLMIEMAHLGGTCVNEGCTPTKTMVTSGRVAYLARRAADYGIRAKVESIDMSRIRQRKRDIVDSFRGGSERRMTGVENLEVMKGEGIFTGIKELKVVLTDGRGEERVKADKWVFISVGERPAVPKLDGLAETTKSMPNRVLNSTSIMELDEVPESLIVLGGGYVGLEFAQLFARLGAEVHIVQRAKQILPREDPEVVEVLQGLLRDEGLHVHLSTEAVSVAQGEGARPISLKIRSGTSGTTDDVRGSHLLLAAGRVPNTDNLNLESTGVHTDRRGYIITDEALETSAPGIYAMGDCKGPPAFTHISYDDFRILRDNLGLQSNSPLNPLDRPSIPNTTTRRKPFVPYCCFTDPQLAHVGLHLHEIPAGSRKSIKVASWPMSWVARGLETDEPRGLMKVVVNAETGQILGFTCLSPEGGEMMTVVQMAMMGGLKWWDLREAVFAHPLWSEALNNIWGALKDAPGE